MDEMNWKQTTTTHAQWDKSTKTPKQTNKKELHAHLQMQIEHDGHDEQYKLCCRQGRLWLLTMLLLLLVLLLFLLSVLNWLLLLLLSCCCCCCCCFKKYLYIKAILNNKFILKPSFPLTALQIYWRCHSAASVHCCLQTLTIVADRLHVFVCLNTNVVC